MKYEAIVSTGEVIVREMTPEEIEAEKQDFAVRAEQEAKINAAKAQAAAAKAALLEKLGITEDEAKLLLS